ncbi:MAG: hypothetical protein M3209_07175 [Acidobacteriota bacterium]|nr:hypothetical protein [Acidobacteriota bacterium]
MKENDTDMLDPLAKNRLSDYEKQVVEDAQNAGNSPNSTAAAGNTTGASGFNTGRGGESATGTAASYTGSLNRTVIPGEIASAESDAPGGDSDISGGLANMGETVNAANELESYNK